MPKDPIDRRDITRLWPVRPDSGHTPPQPPYAGCRSRRAGNTRSWVDLNRLPADASTRRHLGTH